MAAGSAKAKGGAAASETESAIPAGVAAPADHKAKAPAKPAVEQVEVELTNEDGSKRRIPARRVSLRGIVVTVPEEALDDFEVLDDIRAGQDSQDASRLPALLRRLVGDSDYRRVIDGLRGPNGRVSIEDGTTFVLDLFQALNPS
jgi:hypothetical protein